MYFLVIHFQICGSLWISKRILFHLRQEDVKPEGVSFFWNGCMSVIFLRDLYVLINIVTLNPVKAALLQGGCRAIRRDARTDIASTPYTSYLSYAQAS